MFNKVILIGRLGQTAEAKTAQNNKEYVILNIATQESWKSDKGDYESRTEWHRVYAWRNLSKFAKTLQKGQLVTLEGILRYREIEDDVNGTTFRHRIAEIAMDLPALRDGTQQPALFDGGRGHPGVDFLLDPDGDGDGADAPALALEVGQHPPPLALLDGRDIELGQLVPSEGAADQQRQDDIVPLPFQGRAVRNGQQLLGLLGVSQFPSRVPF